MTIDQITKENFLEDLKELSEELTKKVESLKVGGVMLLANDDDSVLVARVAKRSHIKAMLVNLLQGEDIMSLMQEIIDEME